MPATTNAVDVKSFSHVAISVGDVEEARTFYCGVLGLEELRRPTFTVDGLWLRVGDLQLHMVSLPDRDPDAVTPAYHFALYVPTEKFHEAVEAVKQTGCLFRAEPSSRVDFGTTVWAASFRDPFGNYVELTDMGPLA
jgi:extradiol dioxygenase family protein